MEAAFLSRSTQHNFKLVSFCKKNKQTLKKRDHIILEYFGRDSILLPQLKKISKSWIEHV